MSTQTQANLILCELNPWSDAIESHSPFCLKIHRALKAAELTYERRHANQPGAFKQHNPAAQVPVLLVDGTPISDSTRILRYITAERPAALTLPDVRSESEAWLWEELGDTALNGFLVAARWSDARNWTAVKASYFGAAPWFVRALIVPRIRAGVLKSLYYRDVLRAGQDACWKRFEQLLDQLERRAPATAFWMGERLSVADIGLFAQLRALQTELTIWQRDQIARRPALVRYLQRVDVATQSSVRSPIAAVA